MAPRPRFAHFSAEEITMIYTGLLEAPRVAPDWASTETYQRLKKECADAVNSAVARVQRENTDDET